MYNILFKSLEENISFGKPTHAATRPCPIDSQAYLIFMQTFLSTLQIIKKKLSDISEVYQTLSGLLREV